MTLYRVLSDNFALAPKGKTVDAALLDECNIQALVEGGHLAEIGGKAVKSETVETKEQEK
jgi:hypothetical protein